MNSVINSMMCMFLGGLIVVGFVLVICLMISLYYMLIKNNITSIKDDTEYLVLEISDYDFKESFEMVYEDLTLLKEHIPEYSNLSVNDLLRMSMSDFLIAHESKLKNIRFQGLCLDLKTKNDDLI